MAEDLLARLREALDEDERVLRSLQDASQQTAQGLRWVAAARALIKHYEEGVEYYNQPAHRHIPAGELTGLIYAVRTLAGVYGIGEDGDG